MGMPADAKRNDSRRIAITCRRNLRVKICKKIRGRALDSERVHDFMITPAIVLGVEASLQSRCSRVARKSWAPSGPSIWEASLPFYQDGSTATCNASDARVEEPPPSDDSIAGHAGVIAKPPTAD
jgi:hypothetical protein